MNCIVCGKKNYSLSLGGPGICPSCDCGFTHKRNIQKGLHFPMLHPNLIQRAPEALQGAERDCVVLNDPDNEQRTKKSMPMNITMKDINELESCIRGWESNKQAAEQSSNPVYSDTHLMAANVWANKACEIWQRVLLSR